MNIMFHKYNFDSNIELYRFEFSLINSNMYLLCKNNHALIVDPHNSEKLFSLLKMKKIKDITILLTHEHPDHTSGVTYLKKNYKTYLICQENCASSILEVKNNRPTLIFFLLAEKDKKENTANLSKVFEYFKPYNCKTDLTFKEKLNYNWYSIYIEFIHTPGHSKGSSCIVMNNNFIFTGDSLLENEPVIVRFKGGSLEEYKKVTLPFLYTLKSNILVLPGHGEVFRLNKKMLENLKFN